MEQQGQGHSGAWPQGQGFCNGLLIHNNLESCDLYVTLRHCHVLSGAVNHKHLTEDM